MLKDIAVAAAVRLPGTPTKVGSFVQKCTAAGVTVVVTDSEVPSPKGTTSLRMPRKTKPSDVDRPRNDQRAPKRQKASASSKAGQPLEPRAARFCNVHDNGSVTWDKDKLQAAFEPAELEDELFLRNVVRGSIVTGALFPLIFESSDDPTTRLRSISFFRELVATNGVRKGKRDAQGKGNIADYAQLDEMQRMHVAVGVRDLYFADSQKMLSQDEQDLLKKMMEVVDTTWLGHLGGLGFSCCPTRAAKALRFTSELKDLDPELAGFFARVLQGEQTLYAVFVNDQELSFHNFENILPLDRALCSATEEMKLELHAPQRVDQKLALFTMSIAGESVPMLEQLTRMDSLCIEPPNASSRGGRRFIFQSATLSSALSKAVRESGLLELLGSDKFVAVNSVFRCNHFDPGDANFESHRDTPYFDRARSHVSRFTMLLYLTGGKGHPALQVEGVGVEEVAPMTCVVFDQQYQHEGQPFADARKVFVRSELIFEVPRAQLRRCPQAAALFSSACYLTAQSVLQPALSRHAHDCYEQVNALHWGAPAQPRVPPCWLLKTLQDSPRQRFLTNGFDYWFPRDAGSVKACAVLAVLDFFNCVIPARGPFRTLCTSAVVQGSGAQEWVWTQLAAPSEAPAATPSAARASHGPPAKRKAGGWVRAAGAEEKEAVFSKALGSVPQGGTERHCCPFHRYNNFCSWKCPEVAEAMDACCDWSWDAFCRAPVLFLGREVLLDEGCIALEGDKIYVGDSAAEGEAAPRINFAACWNDGSRPPCYIGVKAELAAPRLLLPPMCYVESARGLRLMLDFFRNDWMMDVDAARKIPVPKYLKAFKDIQVDRAPFCEAVNSDFNVQRDFKFFGKFRVDPAAPTSEDEEEEAAAEEGGPQSVFFPLGALARS